MKLRLLMITVQVHGASDDGTDLRPVTLQPIQVEARDLAKLPEMIEAARARAEHRMAATEPAPTPEAT